MFFDIMGWIGMILVLIAYTLLSTNKIKNGMLYQVLNLLAGIFMAIGLCSEKNQKRKTHYQARFT